MKRNAKTLIAGMVALSISHAAMAEDIKVAVVGAMSGPVAQWGDMEFNGARQAIKDINAKGGIKGDKLVPAMVTGDKLLKEPVAASRDTASTRALAALLAVVASSLSWWVHQLGQSAAF